MGNLNMDFDYYKPQNVAYCRAITGPDFLLNFACFDFGFVIVAKWGPHDDNFVRL